MSAKRKKLVYNLVTFGIVILAFILCTALNKSMSRSLRGQLIPICCWIVMAVSLNLVVGISGELSLGHAGFMSIGAFTGIVISGWLLNGFQMENEAFRLVIALLAGGIMAGLLGFLIGIPVLRLRGDYLAIVTLAFGEIIRNVLNCVYVSAEGQGLNFGFIEPNLPGKLLLNGPNGAVSVAKIATFTAGFILVLAALIVVLNLINSRTGRAIMATRDNRIAAESVGISKQKRICRCADYYMHTHRIDPFSTKLRFDVVAITWTDGDAPDQRSEKQPADGRSCLVRWIRNAFPYIAYSRVKPHWRVW